MSQPSSDPILHRLVKCCLACLLVIIGLVCYAIATAIQQPKPSAVQVELAAIKADSQAIRKALSLMLDPDAPAFTEEDRRRVRDMLFPERRAK